MEKSGCVPCAGQSLQEAGRQFGGSGYGGSGYGGSSSGYGLPYGGFGGGYNQAFVECCEGVVNPFILLGIIGGNEVDFDASLRIACHCLSFTLPTGRLSFLCEHSFLPGLAGLTFFLRQQV